MDEDQDTRERSAEVNGDVVRRAVEEIWNRGDLAVADGLFTAAYVNHGGLIPDVVTGPEAIKVAAALHRTAFPDLRVTVEHLIVEGETVALRWVARSSSRDEPGHLASSAPLAGMTFCRFADEKIAESWTSWDAGGILRKVIEATGLSADRGSMVRRNLN